MSDPDPETISHKESLTLQAEALGLPSIDFSELVELAPSVAASASRVQSRLHMAGVSQPNNEDVLRQLRGVLSELEHMTSAITSTLEAN